MRKLSGCVLLNRVITSNMEKTGLEPQTRWCQSGLVIVTWADARLKILSRLIENRTGLGPERGRGSQVIKGQRGKLKKLKV